MTEALQFTKVNRSTTNLMRLFNHAAEAANKGTVAKAKAKGAQSLGVSSHRIKAVRRKIMEKGEKEKSVKVLSGEVINMLEHLVS